MQSSASYICIVPIAASCIHFNFSSLLIAGVIENEASPPRRPAMTKSEANSAVRATNTADATTTRRHRSDAKWSKPNPSRCSVVCPVRRRGPRTSINMCPTPTRPSRSSIRASYAKCRHAKKSWPPKGRTQRRRRAVAECLAR